MPLHFTAFHPDYHMLDTPPTPLATLQKARSIALERGSITSMSAMCTIRRARRRYARLAARGSSPATATKSPNIASTPTAPAQLRNQARRRVRSEAGDVGREAAAGGHRAICGVRGACSRGR